MSEMYVVNRKGQNESVHFDLILERIKKIGGSDLKVNYTEVCMKVICQMVNGITTTALDELTAEQCTFMASIHPDYNKLASRIIVNNHHKNTKASFSEVMRDCFFNVNLENGESSPLITKNYTILCNKMRTN